MSEKNTPVTAAEGQQVTIEKQQKFVELTEQTTYDLLNYFETRPLGETLGIYSIVVAALQKAFPEKVNLNG